MKIFQRFKKLFAVSKKQTAQIEEEHPEIILGQAVYHQLYALADQLLPKDDILSSRTFKCTRRFSKKSKSDNKRTVESIRKIRIEQEIKLHLANPTESYLLALNRQYHAQLYVNQIEQEIIANEPQYAPPCEQTKQKPLTAESIPTTSQRATEASFKTKETEAAEDIQCPIAISSDIKKPISIVTAETHYPDTQNIEAILDDSQVQANAELNNDSKENFKKDSEENFKKDSKENSKEDTKACCQTVSKDHTEQDTTQEIQETSKDTDDSLRAATKRLGRCLRRVEKILSVNYMDIILEDYDMRRLFFEKSNKKTEDLADYDICTLFCPHTG
jgi:hypothetical protein